MNSEMSKEVKNEFRTYQKNLEIQPEVAKKFEIWPEVCKNPLTSTNKMLPNTRKCKTLQKSSQKCGQTSNPIEKQKNAQKSTCLKCLT
jgi:hypothetical protein